MLNVLKIYQDSSAVSHSYESPLRYPGGKSRAVQIITRFFPQGLKTLYSPFLGGGSVELYCASMGVKVTGYDRFEPLADFWQTLLSHPQELSDKVADYYPLAKERFYALQEQQASLVNPVERAAIFYVLNRCSYSGSTLSGGMSPEHPRFTLASIEKLRNFQNPNLTVAHGDFQETIARHPDDFLYLDPPYLVDQKLYGTQGDLHEGFEHEALAELLKGRRRWILSYNNCEAIKNLYGGFRQVIPNWKYGMSEDKISNEILIFSHDVTVTGIDLETRPVFQLSLSGTNNTHSCSDQERHQLERLESVIEKGLKTFVEVGEALLEIRESRLYREQYQTFEEYCQKRWGIVVQQARRLMRASKVVHNLQKGNQLVPLPTSELQVRALGGLELDEQREIWAQVSQGNEPVTGRKVEEAVQAFRHIQNVPKPPPVHFTRESCEWYTPPEIIEATLRLLGTIDLDPCSNSTQNPNVPALEHFTKEMDGLARKWTGRIFFNPPCGHEIREWVEKLNQHNRNGDISEAVALLPAQTDTRWFSSMREYPRCFIQENSAPFPPVLFYLGKNIEGFQKYFEPLGDIFRLVTSGSSQEKI